MICLSVAVAGQPILQPGAAGLRCLEQRAAQSRPGRSQHPPGRRPTRQQVGELLAPRTELDDVIDDQVVAVCAWPEVMHEFWRRAQPGRAVDALTGVTLADSMRRSAGSSCRDAGVARDHEALIVASRRGPAPAPVAQNRRAPDSGVRSQHEPHHAATGPQPAEPGVPLRPGMLVPADRRGSHRQVVASCALARFPAQRAGVGLASTATPILPLTTSH